MEKDAMGKRVCPVCGRMETEDAVYCRECGAKTVEYEDNTKQENGQTGQYSGYQDSASGTSYQSSAGGSETGQNPYGYYQDYTANAAYQAPVDDGASGTNGLQIAGLVCGILAICSCCCYGVPAIILGIAGLICSVQGNKRSRNSVGTAGLVCSIIGLVLGVLAVFYYVWAINYLNQIGYWDEMFDMF